MSQIQSRGTRTIQALTTYASGGGRFDVIPPNTAHDGIEIAPTVRALQGMHRRGELSARNCPSPS